MSRFPDFPHTLLCAMIGTLIGSLLFGLHEKNWRAWLDRQPFVLGISMVFWALVWAAIHSFWGAQ